MKRTKLPKHTTWINLKCIMRSERSQTQKDMYSMTPLIWHFEKGSTAGTENRPVVTSLWELGERVTVRGSITKFGGGG